MVLLGIANVVSKYHCKRDSRVAIVIEKLFSEKQWLKQAFYSWNSILTPREMHCSSNTNHIQNSLENGICLHPCKVFY